VVKAKQLSAAAVKSDDVKLEVRVDFMECLSVLMNYCIDSKLLNSHVGKLLKNVPKSTWTR
jgi:hypothetical protein